MQESRRHEGHRAFLSQWGQGNPITHLIREGNMESESIQLTVCAGFQRDQVIQQVTRTGDRLRNRVGYTSRVRRRAIPLQPVIAAEILRSNDWTIDFKSESEDMKRLGL